jgi:hypothetical protein
MADNWWDKYSAEGTVVPSKTPSQSTDWWDKYGITDEEPNRKILKKGSSHLENVPYFKDVLKQGQQKFDELGLHPDFLGHMRDTEKMAMDIPGSMLMSAATGPGTMAGMFGQGLYGGAAR